MLKTENTKTTVETITEKSEILSAKTEKPISKMTKTVKPKNPMNAVSNIARQHFICP